MIAEKRKLFFSYPISPCAVLSCPEIVSLRYLCVQVMCHFSYIPCNRSRATTAGAKHAAITFLKFLHMQLLCLCSSMVSI